MDFGFGSLTDDHDKSAYPVAVRSKGQFEWVWEKMDKKEVETASYREVPVEESREVSLQVEGDMGPRGF
jgi:hypothetical protein